MRNFAEQVESFFERIRRSSTSGKLKYGALFLSLILLASLLILAIVRLPNIPNPVAIVTIFLLSWYLGFRWGLLCIAWTFAIEITTFYVAGFIGATAFVFPEVLPFLALIFVTLSFVFSRLGENNRAFKRVVLNQLQTEKQLRLREEQLSSIARALPVILFALDNQGTITAVEGNGLKLLAKTPEQLVGNPFWYLFDKNTQEQIKKLSSEVDMVVQQVMLNNRTWEVFAVPIFAQKGLLTGVYGIATDITQQKQMEMQLRQAQQLAEQTSLAKSYFLSTMSHELRTPLATMLGYTELLQEQSGDHPAVKRFADKILWSGQGLLEIVGNMLDLSKIESGQMSTEWQMVEVDSLVHALLDEQRPFFIQNQLQATLPPKLPPLQTDPPKLKKILRHLLENANKFTRHGTVSFLVKLNKETLSFIVQDTGIGMTPTQKEALFQPFQQGDMSLTREYGGIGLGLTVTKQLCHLIGATLTVESESGKGTAVTVQLPLTPLTES